MNALFEWYFHGLGGLGGWVVGAAIAAGAIIGLISNSARRSLPATGWRLGALISAFALLAPTVLAKIASSTAGSAMDIVVLPAGLAGALTPVLLVLLYGIRFRGLAGCPNGHPPYPVASGACPVCQRTTVVGLPGVKAQRSAAQAVTEVRKTSRGASKPKKPHAGAWLIDEDGAIYQVNQGETRIGRAPQNDIRLWESSASRTHARIVAENGQFTIYDLGSVAGTWLNGQRVRRPERLTSGDEMMFGTTTKMVFTTDPKRGSAA